MKTNGVVYKNFSVSIWNGPFAANGKEWIHLVVTGIDAESVKSEVEDAYTGYQWMQVVAHP